MKNTGYSIKKDFTMLALLLVPVAVAINVVGGNIANVLKLPMYLDMIGTIFGAMLCGPWVGALIGFTTNMFLGMTNPTLFPFAITSVIVGLLTGYLSRKGMFSNIWKWLFSAVLITIISTIVSAPIIVLVFGGVTASGASLVTATLLASGQNIWTSVLSSDGVASVLDRIISLTITAAILKVIPDRMMIKFGCGANFIKEKN